MGINSGASAIQKMYVGSSLVNAAYAGLQSILSGNLDAFAAIRQAATRRVDVVMLGDSNHHYGSYGFAWGLSKALQAKYGCYATGMQCPVATSGTSSTTSASVGNMTDNGYASTETGLSSGNAAGFTALNALWWTGIETGSNLIAPRARWCAQNGTSAQSLGGITLFEGNQIGVANTLRFHVGFTRAPSGVLSGGSITPNVRYSRGSTAIIFGAGGKTFSSTGGAAEEVATDYFDIAAGARTAGTDINMRAGGAANIVAPFSYLYSRVENPDANAGMSFHSLFSNAGKSAYDMHLSLSTYSTLAQLTNYFKEVRRLQISKGQTPVVVIYVNTNFNDANAPKSPTPDGGVTPAGSPGAFVHWMGQIKQRITEVWTTNGWATSELNWLFVPSHKGTANVPAGTYATEYAPFVDNRAALSASALGIAAQTNVLDLATVMNYATALAGGWYSTQVDNGSGGWTLPAEGDMIHLTAASNPGAYNAASRGYDGVCALIAGLI